MKHFKIHNMVMLFTLKLINIFSTLTLPIHLLKYALSQSKILYLKLYNVRDTTAKNIREEIHENFKNNKFLLTLYKIYIYIYTHYSYFIFYFKKNYNFFRDLPFVICFSNLIIFNVL